MRGHRWDGGMSLTDFTGDVDMNCVWKLKGFAPEGAAAPELDASPSLLAVSRSSVMLKAKVGVGGARKPSGRSDDEGVRVAPATLGGGVVAPAALGGGVNVTAPKRLTSGGSSQFSLGASGMMIEGGLLLLSSVISGTSRPGAMEWDDVQVVQFNGPRAVRTFCSGIG